MDKEFFVFAAIIFSGNLTNEIILKNNIITFILFCLTSSTIYILNDIVDLEKDKNILKRKTDLSQVEGYLNLQL